MTFQMCDALIASETLKEIEARVASQLSLEIMKQSDFKSSMRTCYVEAEHGDSSRTIIMRNSFDMREMSQYDSCGENRREDDRRPLSAECDDRLSFSERQLDPALDMGHLSRRVYMGTDTNDGASDGSHERSFGYRRVFNRGNGSFRSVSSADEGGGGEGRSGRYISERRSQISISSDAASGVPPSVGSVVVVSPLLVSKYIATLILPLFSEAPFDKELSVRKPSFARRSLRRVATDPSSPDSRHQSDTDHGQGSHQVEEEVEVSFSRRDEGVLGAAEYLPFKRKSDVSDTEKREVCRV